MGPATLQQTRNSSQMLREILAKYIIFPLKTAFSDTEPATFAKPGHEPEGHANHQADDQRIPPHPFQLGHVLKVHSVKPGNET